MRISIALGLLVTSVGCGELSPLELQISGVVSVKDLPEPPLDAGLNLTASCFLPNGQPVDGMSAEISYDESTGMFSSTLGGAVSWGDTCIVSASGTGYLRSSESKTLTSGNTSYSIELQRDQSGIRGYVLTRFWDAARGKVRTTPPAMAVASEMEIDVVCGTSSYSYSGGDISYQPSDGSFELSGPAANIQPCSVEVAAGAQWEMAAVRNLAISNTAVSSAGEMVLKPATGIIYGHVIEVDGGNATGATIVKSASLSLIIRCDNSIYMYNGATEMGPITFNESGGRYELVGEISQGSTCSVEVTNGASHIGASGSGMVDVAHRIDLELETT